MKTISKTVAEMTKDGDQCTKTVAEKMKDGDLLTIEESAGPLGQKDHWGVRNLINFYELPVIRYGARGIRLDPEDIREWKRNHREIVTF